MQTIPASTPVTEARMSTARHAVRLTPRQSQVLALMCRGLSSRRIADVLGCRESTVKAHVGSVLRAFNARSRLQAVACCLAQEQLVRELSQDAILARR